LRLRQPRRLPRTLSAEQIVALVEACEYLGDRFLLVLLAETGMRIGQALGLRHADFVSHRRQLRIVPRPDNANGAKGVAAPMLPAAIALPTLVDVAPSEPELSREDKGQANRARILEAALRSKEWPRHRPPCVGQRYPAR